MSTKITVVSAVADKNNIVLYLQDGTTETLSNRDFRTADIMKQVLPAMAARKPVEITLEDFSHHTKFSSKTGGLVKFFRVAKSMVAGIFGSGSKPTADAVEKQGSTRNLDNPPLSDTVVAVVGEKVIPEVEKLNAQISYAAESGGTGMGKFLERLAAIIDERRHSVQDLLTFLERADLPIADDGSIIAYKRLRTTGTPGILVDSHSGKVTQRVGSRVVMDVTMVDPNRRRSCSNGLHIARRDYLSTFYGDAIVICKIAPEDVIAVPEYDSSKMRVAAYDILARVSEPGFQLLSSGRSLSEDPASMRQLSRILSGDHIQVNQQVQITGQNGSGLVITKLDPQPASQPAPEVRTHTVLDPEAPSARKQLPSGQALSPKQIREELQKEQAKKPDQPKQPEKPKKPKKPKKNKAKKSASGSRKSAPLSKQQIAAVKRVQAGEAKAKVARDLGVHSRSLDRWLDKYAKSAK